MTSLPRRLFWLAFWVVGFAVAMTGLLLYFKYQSVFTGLQRDRILLVAREIDEIAERDLSLGQDFWGIDTLPEVIERRRTAETFLQAIDVAGPDGRIAYASDMSRMGSSLPPEWMPLVTKPAPLAAFSPSRDEAVVSSPIRNGFGQVAGYTVVRYGRELEHEAMAKFTREIVFACGVSWAGFTLLLFALLMAMRRRIEGVFGRAADAVDGTGPVPAALAQELGRAGERFAQAERLLHAAGSPR
ncbi:MAG: hypothetical protein IPJ28_22400 [Betaproteobacteria bacterium]|nr:hypothetical protein [Betaproteobacteria bacterium]